MPAGRTAAEGNTEGNGGRMGGVAGWGRGGMAARGRTRARRESGPHASLSGLVGNGMVGC